MMYPDKRALSGFIYQFSTVHENAYAAVVSTGSTQASAAISEGILRRPRRKEQFMILLLFVR